MFWRDLMVVQTGLVVRLAAVVAFILAAPALSGPAELYLSQEEMVSAEPPSGPVLNAAFAPGDDALQAAPLHAHIHISQTRMNLSTELAQPLCDGRPVAVGGSCRGGSDKRVFPAVTLEVFSFDEDRMLGAAQAGLMISEDTRGLESRSYWQLIPQYGRVWKEPSDGDWSRAAFPIMLVHDFENVAHQGIATFLYREGEISRVRFQFVQQSTPWNTPEHFIAWGVADAVISAADGAKLADLQSAGTSDLRDRMPTRSWSALEAQYPAGALDGFGGPIDEQWIVMNAVLKDGVVYFQDSMTPYGPFPYPEEMRFGVRSLTKSVTVPLSLARLAQTYGPYVLNLNIGHYVEGLHEKYDRVRFIDAANMATGMGGAGTLVTVPNDGNSGYVDETYDDWYNEARSSADKVAYIVRDTGPYPWPPGVVYRYRDRDHHLLGAAVDGFLKATRGPQAHVWDMFEEEIFRPIGIRRAPTVKTVESDGQRGLPWFHAGFYPLLDDLAKIAQLYKDLGRHDGRQILYPDVVSEIFSIDGTLIKDHDHSVEMAFPLAHKGVERKGRELYKMGFHYTPYTNSAGRQGHIPTMAGHAGTELMFHPNGIISIRFAKAWPLPEEPVTGDSRSDTISIVDALGQ